MPKTRIDAAQAVANAFLPAERSAQETAVNGALCIATIIEQRSKAQLSPHTGAAALALIAEATQQAVAAANTFATAHAMLADLPAELGIPVSFGPACAPNTLEVRPALSAVA